MKIKSLIGTLIGNVKNGISRFAVSFILSVILFLMLSYETIWNMDNNLLYECCNSLFIGIMFSVLFVLVSERTRLLKIVADILSILPVILCFFITKAMGYQNDYFVMGYWGIILALVCFIVCMLFTKENSSDVIPFIIKNTFFITSVCVVLSIGILVCLSAFDALIFDFDSDVYLVAMMFIWIVIFINLFVAHLPRKDDDIQIPKIFKTIVVYVALPVYILLMVILYVYLLKIVITRNMPVGQINWIASFASLFFVFFVFAVRMYKDKITVMFTKLIGYFIIPVVLMQLVAIYERVSAYGLTTPRIVSIILVAISIVFALCSILRKKHEYVIAFVGVVILVFTLIPQINIIELPKKSQVSILEEYLTKNNMLVDGKIVANANVDDKDKEKILSSYGYLKYSAAGTLPDWIVDTENMSNSEVFGFTNSYNDNNMTFSYGGADYVDISQYNGVYDVDIDFNEEKDAIRFNINGQEYSYKASEIGKYLYDTYGEGGDVGIIPLDENLSLLVESIYIDCFKEIKSIKHLYIDGYILTK